MDRHFQPAVQAIYAGRLDILRGLLAEDPLLAGGTSSCSHPTLLQFVAVESGLGKIATPADAARLLIQHGASPQQAMLAAASTAALEVLDVLLQHGAVLGTGDWRPLDEALYWGHSTFASELLRRGAPVDRLRAAAGVGELDRVQEFFVDGALSTAAGDICGPFADRVDPALASAPQQIMDHAMIIAVLNGQLGTAGWLLDQGAAINGKPTGFHWAGAALHAAIWRGSEETVRWLLARGADPTVKDDAYQSDAVGWARHHQRDDLVVLFA